MPALGIDIDGGFVDDLGHLDVDRFLTLVDERKAVAIAVLGGLLHPVGRLWWEPDCGLDLKSYLHSSTPASVIEAGVARQIELHERVETSTVVAEIFGNELKLTMQIVLTQDETAITLTLHIDDLGTVLDASIVD